MLEYDIERVTRFIVLLIIKQAVNDYQNDCLKKNDSFWQADAKSFLFKGRRLEKLLEKYEMRDEMNCNMIRKRANKKEVKVVKDE